MAIYDITYHRRRNTGGDLTEVCRWPAGNSPHSGHATYQGSGGDLETGWTPASGTFPDTDTFPTTTYRLQQVGGLGREGQLSISALQPDTRRDIRIGTAANMRSTWGFGTITTGGDWVLSTVSPRSTLPEAISFELADIAATGGGVSPITPPPPPTTTYQNVATWNAAGYPGGSTTTVFAYANASLGLHYSCNVATSGTAPLTQPPAGTYRIRVSGGGSSAAQTGLIGSISYYRAQDGATNQCTIRIGTSSQWGTAFAGVPSSGVVWHLERQTTTTPTGVESTGATWNAGSGSANQTAIYQANGVLAVNSTALTGFYNGSVPAGSLWRIRRAGQNSTAPFRTLTNLQIGSNFFVLRVGSNADMTALFGTSQIQTGAAWILERQSSGGDPGQRGTTTGFALTQRPGFLEWQFRDNVTTGYNILGYDSVANTIIFREEQ